MAAALHGGGAMIALGPPVLHIRALARPGHLLFRTWEEAGSLWRMCARAFPGLSALCLMPDHLHLLAPCPNAGFRLARLCSGYSRWRFARRRGRGSPLLFREHPPPEELPNAEHLRRTRRYIHLNPCRAGLVDDPLAWPFSTHRDALGYAGAALVTRVADPPSFHRYVSSDPSVRVDGTPLPSRVLGGACIHDVVAAVSAVERIPAPQVTASRRARQVAVHVAAHFTSELPAAVVAEALELSRSRVHHLRQAPPARGSRESRAVLAALCVLADGRFGALAATDLLREPGWQSYRGRT